MNGRRFLVGASLLGAVLAVVLGFVLLRSAWTPPAPLPEAEVPAPPSAVATREAPPPEDRTPEIRGHILSAEGNPVGGAVVRLVSTTPPYDVYRATKTGEDGAFSLAHLGTERGRVVAEHGPDGVVTSAVVRPAAGQTIEMTLVLARASAVKGTVTDEQGHPVAGAVVSVDGVAWAVSATTDDAGSFRLSTVPDEAKTLVAVARGYKSGRARLGPRSDQAELEVRIVLSAGSPIAGEVRDDQGSPVGASVVACEDSPREARVASGADGTFTLPASTLGCEVFAEDAELAPSDVGTVVEGRGLLLRLKPGGSVAGVVVDERGASPSPFDVGIESFVPARGRSAPRKRLQSFDDAAGRFRWDRLAPGTYVFSAAALGRPAAKSEPVEVRGGVVTSGVRIVVPPGGAVAGHVFGPGRAPIAGAHLRFDFASSVIENKAAATTDGAGQYRIEGAPAGPFTLRVDADGYRSKMVSALRAPSGTTLPLDVLVTPGSGMELGGIGAGLAPSPGGIAIGRTFDGDPAATAGLKEGDRIVRIDGDPIAGLSLADVLQRIRGEPGTSVGITAERPSTGETMELTIVRGEIAH